MPLTMGSQLLPAISGGHRGIFPAWSGGVVEHLGFVDHKEWSLP